MKTLLFSFLLLLISIKGFSSHIIGGELRYEYVGPGTLPNTKIYRIILILVKGDNIAGAPLAPSYVVGIFNNDDNSKVIGNSLFNDWTITMQSPGIQPLPILSSPCLTNPPTLSYTWATYATTVQLSNNASGYTLTYQTCCRQTGMQNVSDVGTSGPGSTYMATIPGTNQLAATLNDNSPQYKLPLSVICHNSEFTLDFGATDIDGDSLVYSFCEAYNGGLATNAAFEDPAPPPYTAVPYTNGFTATTPLGNLATINPQTGIISGISPAAGNYIICVCVRAYRNGVLITTHRKDLMVRVSPCIVTNAVTNPGYITCDGFNIQFNHNSTNANTVFWDFGDPLATNDTSSDESPVYIYPDTGRYTVKFWINKGESCSDSTTLTMGIYPGFFPGFEAMAPFCEGVPVRFNDTSLTSYGEIDSWSWNFGNTATLSDTSNIKNPSYTYPSAGTYMTSLTVTNSKGCKKTVNRPVTILATPSLSVFPRDSSYCARDTLRLNAIGTGNFSWSPSTNIIGGTSATPQVFPSVPTTYFVTINSNGCTRRDSVKLNPLNDLATSITAQPDTICRLDTLLLTGSTNHHGTRFRWEPSGMVSNPTLHITKAFPLTTTPFTLTTRWGTHCVATATKNIVVRQLATPATNQPPVYCIGQQPVQLNATGGATYSWSPTTGLSDVNIPNPLASPQVTTQYVVSVGVNGCARRVNDTVMVTARPKPVITETNDTLICIIDTLRLNASGAGNIYSWSPSYMISNVNVPNPLVSPDVPTWYYVRLTDSLGCFNTDSVLVDVKPDVQVFAGNDTTICRTDRFIMGATGDAVSYLWTPATGLSNVNIRNPMVFPDSTTTYTVRANIGKCEKQSRVTIRVAPIPAADAGGDTTVCMGFSTQLSASGGSIYSWAPPAFLSATNIPNPIVSNPSSTIKYVVTVSDTLGCPRMVKDSVVISVVAQLNVDAGPHDTSVVVGQTLPLNATGALTYLWDPGTYLNSTTTSSVTSTPEADITYTVTGTDEYGCKGTDSILVRVYDLVPSMYVPTAFTPNGDNLNDVVKPIMVGMRSLKYFQIYNRYGEMVFATTEQGKGWDGIYQGKPQGTATFVWMAQGETYKGQLITKKGYVVLIR